MIKRISRRNGMKFQFENNIVPVFPDVDFLLEKAERCTTSCVHADQVLVSRNFFKSLAWRGAYSRKYTEAEVKRVATILDYMAETRMRQLSRTDRMIVG